MPTHVETAERANENRRWWLVDAKGQPLGRLASKVAQVLRGKHKPTFQPDTDTGDFVVVVNAAEVKVTGNKANDKTYHTHSGYPGAIRTETYRHLVVRHPEKPIELAVKGMLPKNVLGRKMIEKLKVYGDGAHPHQAQKPEPLKI